MSSGLVSLASNYRANALASLPPPEHFLTDKVPQTLTYSWADQSTIVEAFSLRVSAYGDQSISFVLHILATNQVARAVRTGFEPVLAFGIVDIRPIFV